MKKYLLFLFIALTHTCLFAQDYKNQGYYEMEITYTVVGSGHHTCGDESRIIITGSFEQGNPVIITESRLDITSSGSVTKKVTYIFPTNNLLKTLDIYSHRKYENAAGNCKTAGGGHKEMADFTYPNFEGTMSGLIGYGATSKVKVTIKPLTNRKLLTISMKASSDFMLHYGYESQIKFTNNTSVSLASSIRNTRSISTGNSYHNITYYAHYNPNDPTVLVSALNITNIFERSSNWYDASWQTNINLPGIHKFTSSGLPVDVTIEATYNQIEAPIDGSRDVVTPDTKTTLIAKGGFPKASHHWKWCRGDKGAEYLLNEDNWKDLPAKFQNTDQPEVTGRDLLGNDYSLATSADKNKIHFRYYPGKDDKRFSATQTFPYQKDAPTVKLHETIDNTCNYSSNGIVKLKFSRPLDLGETINLTFELDGTTHDGVQDISLDANNCYTHKGLPKGNYIVNIIAKYKGEVEYTGKVNNANHSVTFTINSPDPLNTTGHIQTNVNCFGGHDGKVIFNKIQGGTAPYSYLRSGSYKQEFRDSTEIPGLYASTYTIKIYDKNNCQIRKVDGTEQIFNTTITQPEKRLTIAATDTTPPRGFGLNDGTIVVYGDGGTPGYHSIWQKNGQPFSDYQDSAIFSVARKTIGDGLYHIRMQDSRYQTAYHLNSAQSNINGCYGVLPIRIIEPPKLEVSLTTKDSVQCFGDENGSIIAHATGGVPYKGDDPYRYTWSLVRPDQDSRDTILKELPSSRYRVTVTDKNNISTLSDEYFLPQPELLQAQVTGNTLKCDGDTTGRVTATVQGGTTPYYYRWASIYPMSGDTTAQVNNLTGGKYTTVVTDRRHCTTFATGQVTVPGGMQTDTLVTPPICHNASDGRIQMTISKGAGSYKYDWNTGAATSELNNLPSGRYSVKVTDANDCFLEHRFTLPNPAPLLIDLGPDKTLCLGQTFNLSAAIPDARAAYKWFNRYGLFSEEAETEVSGAGLYRVAVTDNKGCLGEDSITITTREVEIVADFIAADKAACTIPTCFFNISHPAPERVEWLLPDEPAMMLINQSEQQLEVSFNKEGTYTIGLRTGVGDCEKTLYKEITVVGKYDLTEYEPQEEAFLKQFKLWPNPSNGQFTVLVELSEPADIQLRLLSMTGAVIEIRQLQGKDHYEALFTSGAASGMYVLQLVSKKAVASIQVVIIN